MWTMEPVECIEHEQVNAWTTSSSLERAIHGKLCKEDHEHRQIAGNTKIDGKNFPLSRFTERYPIKFARQVSRILLHSVPKDKPIFAVGDHDVPDMSEHRNIPPRKGDSSPN